MVVSRSNQKLIWYGIIISITVLGQYLRSNQFPILFPINVLFLVCLAMWGYIYSERLSLKKISVYLLLLGHTLLVCVVNRTEINETLRALLYMFGPTLMLAYDVSEDRIDYYKLSKKIIKAYNFFVVSLIAIYFLDFLLNGLPMKLITNIAVSIKGWLPSSYIPFTYRYASYVGHYIFTSECYIIFFMLNIAFYNKTKEFIMGKQWIYIISIIGVLSTGSKSGIIVLSILFVITVLNGRKRIISLIMLLVLILVLNYLNAFDLIMSRFMDSGDLSTGRNSAWAYIIADGQYSIKLFSGVGFDLVSKFASVIGNYWASITLEYPFYAYLYMYGVVNTISYIIYIFGFPIWEFYKNKSYYLCIFMIMLFALISTYNSILAGPDAMILYVMTVITFKYISNIATNMHIK